jgi:hypothetical protein
MEKPEENRYEWVFYMSIGVGLILVSIVSIFFIARYMRGSKDNVHIRLNEKLLVNT